MQALTYKQNAKGLDCPSAIELAEKSGGVRQAVPAGLPPTFLFSDGSKAVIRQGEPVAIEVTDPDGVTVQELQLFADESGRLVEAIWPSTADQVEFSSQGGGFVRRLPRAEFEQRFKPAQLPSFSLCAITAEWLPDTVQVQAYSNGQRWNGWAMPYFPAEAAQQLLEYMPDLRYDAQRDAYVAGADDGETEEDIFEAQPLIIAGKEVKTYPIGAGCWCWEHAT